MAVRGSLGFGILMVLQLVCGSILFWDVVASLLGIEYQPVSWTIIELVEIGAILGLLLGVMVSASLLRRALRRQKDAESRLKLASSDFMEVVEARFKIWSLTPAERDVALFSIKGLSTAEIAALRQTSEGTVKAQTNAIYRKARVTGRAQLLSLFIEDLFRAPDDMTVPPH